MDNLREEISVQLTLAEPDSFKDAIRLARKAESKSTVIASRRKYEDIFSMKMKEQKPQPDQKSSKPVEVRQYGKEVDAPYQAPRNEDWRSHKTFAEHAMC